MEGLWRVNSKPHYPRSTTPLLEFMSPKVQTKENPKIHNPGLINTVIKHNQQVRGMWTSLSPKCPDTELRAELSGLGAT
jgi:hypothetical protein